MADPAGNVAVIGAGSSGLAAARNFLAAGFAVDVFEQEPDLGGLWNYGQSSGRVYRSTHTISSKPGTEYPDFPMPRDYPDYPHHSQILTYLRAYAERFGLLPHIRFGTPVARVEPETEADPPTPWRVSLAGGETCRYDILVIANGHNWSPNLPEYPGRFAGLTLHSADYRTPDLFTGKRVLVVGGGNSGCDIAVEAAQNGIRAWHSTRRGYWYLPKYLLGRPSDQVGELLLALHAPLGIRRAAATLLYRIHVGSPRRLGLPLPDHRLFESHPIVNTLLPYYVRHGAITPKPEIAGFDGHTVRFRDGSSIEADVIVFATGYRTRFPFLDQRVLNGVEDRPRFYLHVFHPLYDTLFVAGMIQPDSGQFGLVHWQMRAAAAFARARAEGQNVKALRARKAGPSEDLGHGIRYQDSPRHHLEVEHWSYQRRLRRLVRELGSSASTRAL